MENSIYASSLLSVMGPLKTIRNSSLGSCKFFKLVWFFWIDWFEVLTYFCARLASLCYNN